MDSPFISSENHFEPENAAPDPHTRHQDPPPCDPSSRPRQTLLHSELPLDRRPAPFDHASPILSDWVLAPELLIISLQRRPLAFQPFGGRKRKAPLMGPLAPGAAEGNALDRQG